MKSEFSSSWDASVQPRKQRKFVANAPLHVKHRFLSANLSKELRKKYGKRNLPLRTGDEVLVMRGSFAKKKAKVSSLDLRNSKIYLEGIVRSKKDGSKINVPFHPSNLQIQTLFSEDKLRISSKENSQIEKKSKEKETKNASN
jgi:large subunit ribosomal protein L24